MEDILAGVDEVGRGPLAGPVMAAAVILDPTKPIQGLVDSKKISEKKRELLYHEITEKALAFGIAEANVEEIDRINILNASLLAMKRAIEMLPIKPNIIKVDGLHCPKIDFAAKLEPIIKGDSKVEAISAASIIAKVTRDRLMGQYEREFPGYGFGQHKGYPTKSHRLAIAKQGALPIHRKSFKLHS